MLNAPDNGLQHRYKLPRVCRPLWWIIVIIIVIIIVVVVVVVIILNLFNRINSATLKRLDWSVVITHTVWMFSVVSFQLSELLHLDNKIKKNVSLLILLSVSLYLHKSFLLLNHYFFQAPPPLYLKRK